MPLNTRWMTAILLTGVLSGNLAYGQTAPRFDLFPLWTGKAIPKSQEVVPLAQVTFRTIKKYEPQKDGYRFLHGVAIARYRGGWVVSFGHNKGPENTGSEEAQSLFSPDGENWGPLTTIDNPPGDQAVSHGVLLSYQDTLWSFNASFQGIMQHLQTNAYIWNDGDKQWVFQGVVAEDGFWPLQEPQQMKNGDWIMAGASVAGETVPAVAICKPGDLRHWAVRKISTPVKVWGESTVIPQGSHVMLICRSGTSTPKFGGLSHPLAWVSFSQDYGQTWSELQPSNLPMAASKPYAGVLSNGQRYLIATTTADARNARHPLTIAVSRPGEDTFSKIYCIRHAVHNGGGVESDPEASLAYPYAIEYNGRLWVVYSNSGGRSGVDRSMWNNNSAEMAVIPIEALKAE